jgi:arylsulfatase A-like enzyme
MTPTWPRREFFYWNDGGELVALRYDDWKLVFKEQRARGFMVWSEPFVSLRIPKIFNLRTDPFERADTDANNYQRWWIERVFALVPGADLREGVHRDLPGVPAAPEAREVQRGRRAPGAAEPRQYLI